MPRKKKTPRIHGDSYADPSARASDDTTTESSHGAREDRRPEEPSDAPLDAPERLDGDL